jgi:predicted transcriptional regulator
MEDINHLECLEKKYLPNSPVPEPMELDESPNNNQILPNNKKKNNEEINDNTDEKNEETLIKEIKEDLQNKIRTQYSIRTRLNVIALVKRFNYSQNKICEIFHISQKSVRRFLKQEMNLKISARKNAFRVSSKKTLIDNFNIFEEMQICNWINNLRNNKKTVSAKSVILKASELKEVFANKSIKAKVSLVYRFLKRIGYSIRRVTHKGQITPENAEILKKNFY